MFWVRGVTPPRQQQALTLGRANPPQQQILECGCGWVGGELHKQEGCATTREFSQPPGPNTGAPRDEMTPCGGTRHFNSQLHHKRHPRGVPEVAIEARAEGEGGERYQL